jgi:NTP pyrophosphatase (non-canonical NTP hydrolase)
MSRAGQIADQLSAREHLDHRDPYIELLRVGKLAEEAGEAMEALIAYHGANPRKAGGGKKADVVKELADVAVAAKVAIESFGFDSNYVVGMRERHVLKRLSDLPTTNEEGRTDG